ncbi:hypothetical protein ACNQVK_02870 [Mycobacterium sp. 134]|uniref:hypothetical protein n=1 Tax=Mycobacterium sp. 134 TaxID=3400425 RepID=UPI003AAA9471
MHPGTPSSVPVPLLVYAVASRATTELQPLPDSTVTLHRSSAESEVAKFDEGEVALVERRILPWAPAREENDRLSLYEYTVGYRDGDHHTPWGLSFSTDRSAIETELAAVQTAIAESNVDGSFDVLMLERPIFPWYFARPRPAELH